MNTPPVAARHLPYGRLAQRSEAAAREVRRPPQRGRSRRLVTGVTLTAIVMAVPLAAVAIRVARGFESKPVPVSLRSFDSPGQKQLQAFLGSGATATRVANNGQLAYYLVRGPHGVCLASGSFRGGRPTAGSMECADDHDADGLLPTTKRPLVLDVEISIDPSVGPKSMKFRSISGLTAQGVARVAASGKDGQAVLDVPVVGRIFTIPSAEVSSVYALQAEAADGSPIGPQQRVLGR